MDRYDEVDDFYRGSWSRDQDEPADWGDLTADEQTKVRDAYMKYQIEYVEWEEWFYNPSSYYGVSR